MLAGLADQRDTQLHHLLAGKLTWRANARTDFAFTLLGDPFTHNSVTGSSDPLPLTVEPSVVLGRQTGGGTTAAVHGRHEFSPGAQLNFSVSRLDRHNDFGPRSGSTSPSALARVDDFTANLSSGGFGYSEQSRESRTALRIAMTLLRSTHTIKFGAEYEANTFSDDVRLSLISRSADSVYDWLEQLITARVRNRIPTLYAQDAWEVNQRLGSAPGCAREAQHLSGDMGPSRTIQSEFSPRFGVVYQLGELGSQRLFASAGRFFEQVKPFGQIFWNGGGSLFIREFPLNPLVDSANGVVLAQLDFTAVPVTPDLVGQYYDQIAVGYERRVGTALRIGVHGTYRVLRWAIEDGVAPGIGVPDGQSPPGTAVDHARARQRYAALVFSVERSVPGPVYLLASYVLSRNRGNYTGLFATDFLLPGPNSGPQYDVPDSTTISYGLLPNDRTHVAKVAASYRAGFGLTVGGFLTVASGTPLSEEGTSASGFPYLTFVRQRGSAGRTPTIWSLDLHGAYDLPLAGSGRIRPRLLPRRF